MHLLTHLSNVELASRGTRLEKKMSQCRPVTLFEENKKTKRNKKKETSCSIFFS
jgi:hypothetical protein